MSAPAHPLAALRGSRSVAWLALESSVPELTIVRIEGGITRRPHGDTWNKLAAALGADAGALEVQHVQFLNAANAQDAAA